MFNTESFLEELRRTLGPAAQKSPPTFMVVTLEEAAISLGIAVSEVHDLLARGRLLCSLVGHQKMISRDELERVKALRPD